MNLLTSGNLEIQVSKTGTLCCISNKKTCKMSETQMLLTMFNLLFFLIFCHLLIFMNIYIHFWALKKENISVSPKLIRRLEEWGGTFLLDSIWLYKNLSSARWFINIFGPFQENVCKCINISLTWHSGADAHLQLYKNILKVVYWGPKIFREKNIKQIC